MMIFLGGGCEEEVWNGKEVGEREADVFGFFVLRTMRDECLFFLFSSFCVCLFLCVKENGKCGIDWRGCVVFEEGLCFVGRREGRGSFLCVLERRIGCCCYFSKRRRLGENGMR